MINMAQKTFVLDTNVLLFDPEALFKMEDNNIVILDIVLEEIDRFKSEQSERGQDSRKVSRYLDELNDKGSVINGVSLGEDKGKLFIHFSPTKETMKSFEFDLDKYDNRFLAYCAKNKDYILITKDVNLRVKASTLHLNAEDYQNDKIIRGDEKSYCGRTIALAQSFDLEDYNTNGYIELDKLFNVSGEKFDEKVFCNEFFELYAADTNNKSCLLGRFDGEKIVKLKYETRTLHKTISPRNIGQRFMLECLLTPPSKAPLVIIKGIAGTAKTLFALAAGLDQYASSQKGNTYNKILICRPSVTMDEEIGFLPGNENEKIAPYMRAIKDNVFTIFNMNNKNLSNPSEYKRAENEVEQVFEDDYIKTEALAYQRGRSLNNYYFILDEMQNSTIRQAKACVTRVGRGTKVILLGDPDQIDSPYLDSQTNGLTYASEKMKDSPLCWQVTMKPEECERSPLAEEAAKRM